jgi:propanol-preferring alcohol dehydrogenase
VFAMVLRRPGSPLIAETRPDPEPGPGEVRIRVAACGVCRTDLHVVDGELAAVRDSLVPGHEVIGRIEAIGPGVQGFAKGDRVGAAWLGRTCGRCPYCLSNRENLCDAPEFNGWTRDGGYADVMIVRADYCFPIPAAFTDAEAAPLMCAGLIGYRCWRKAAEAGPVQRLGLSGFGAAAS